MIRQIKSIDDVKAFAKHLVQVENLSFHPDDDFNDYINLETQKASYSEEDARLRNKLMKDCFIVCEKNNVEIYEILLPIIQEPFIASKIES